jgi:serine O-acetyltransferase
VIFVFKGIRADIQAIRERDPAARSALEVLLLYPGLHALILHRPAHWLYKKGLPFPARVISQFSRFLTGIEIHPGAKIGRGILIDHGSGVVIGETAEVGDGCTLYQGVTLGGTGKDTGKRHPTLGKNVLVGSGAKILGPFKIGDGAKIASNAVVLQPLPEGATAVGVPARVVRVKGKKVNQQLDHVHIPDPVAQELCKLQVELRRLRERMDQIEEGIIKPDGKGKEENNHEAV